MMIPNTAPIIELTITLFFILASLVSASDSEIGNAQFLHSLIFGLSPLPVLVSDVSSGESPSFLGGLSCSSSDGFLGGSLDGWGGSFLSCSLGSLGGFSSLSGSVS